MIAQLVRQTFFAVISRSRITQSNYRTNFCCNFLPCFIQNRSVPKKTLPSAKITELIAARMVCCNLAVMKLQNYFLEVFFAPGIYFGDNSIAFVVVLQ